MTAAPTNAIARPRPSNAKRGSEDLGAFRAPSGRGDCEQNRTLSAKAGTNIPWVEGFVFALENRKG